MRVNVGCGQITWRGQPPETALSDIAASGYEGAPLNARGRTASEVTAQLDQYGLRPAPGYLGGDFWIADKHDEYVALARQYAEVSRELGVSEVYVSAGGFDHQARSGRTRREAAAHVTDEDSLTDEDFGQLARTVEAMGKAMLEHGVRCCYHNHVGTYVETEAEIERLLSMVDPAAVFLGPDTGHLAWAGVDVVEFTRRHAERIKTMHLKDMVASVRDKGRAAGWDYATFEKNGIWTEIAEGDVDFGTVFSILDGVGFEGWLIVETDVTQRETPLESAKVSRNNLRNNFGI